MWRRSAFGGENNEFTFQHCDSDVFMEHSEKAFGNLDLEF